MKNASFKKYLDNTSNYTLKMILRHFNISDEEGICSIISFIDNELIKKESTKYIFKSFKVLNNPSNYKNIKDFKNIIINLNKLEKDVRTLSNIYNKEFYNIILDNIELLKKQLDFTSEIVDNEKTLEEFTFKVIFEIKNINLCIELFKTYPDIINTKDNNDIYLIDKLIDKYLEVLKGNNKYLLSYYDAVINSLLINCHDKINNDIVTKITKTLKSYKTVNNNEKINLFLDRVISNIRDTYIFSKEEDISNIYNINLNEPKYSINPIIRENYDEIKDKCIVTMDGKYTKIRDDAFSVTKLKNGNYLLDIYSSNVSSYVLTNSDLDKRARMLGKTIWTNIGPINMLPSSLSENVLSLNKGLDRRCICYSFEFTKELELISFNIRRALINPNYNICYEDFDNISKDDIDLYNTISLAHIFLELNDYNNVFINEYHALKTIRRQILNVNNKNRDIKNNNGEKLINIFKLLLGNQVSKLVYYNDLPFIYRVNNAKLDKNIEQLLNTVKDNDTILNIINSVLGKSYYSINNIGHKGLGLDYYSNFSISIRNYVSLVLERLICRYFIDKENLSDKALVDIEKYLNHLADEMNLRMHLNDEYVLELNKIKKRTNNGS